AYLDKIAYVIEDLAAERFFMRSGRHCGWCDYRPLCLGDTCRAVGIVWHQSLRRSFPPRDAPLEKEIISPPQGGCKRSVAPWPLTEGATGPEKNYASPYTGPAVPP